MKECSICFEDEEQQQNTQWETPCTNNHVYCRPCIIKWMKQCKERRRKFDCPVCKQELDDTLYLDSALEQDVGKHGIGKFLSHIFFGYLVPLGMLMLLVYVINTVKNKVSCVFASFFILFFFFLYVKTYNFVPEISVHP